MTAAAVYRYCVKCGSEFTQSPTGGRLRTQCANCYVPHKPRTRTCAWCSAEYSINNAGRKYCAPACRAAATKERDRTRSDTSGPKQCRGCHQHLDRAHFHLDRQRPDGRYPYCKECRRTRAGSSPYKPTVWESRAAYERDRNRRLNETNPVEAHRRRRANHLWTKYRITAEEYLQMLADQGGGCAICGSTMSLSSSTKSLPEFRFAVDHDHSCCPGKRSCGRCIRGLLCRSCNTGLGFLGDTTTRLVKAIDYLKRYEAKPLGLGLLDLDDLTA